MKNLKKFILGVITLSMILNPIVIYGSVDISEINNGVQLLKEKYYKQLDEQNEVMKKVMEDTIKKYQRVDELEEFIESKEELKNHYVGCYVNDEGEFCIQFTNKPQCKELDKYVIENGYKIVLVKYKEEDLEEVESEFNNTVFSKISVEENNCKSRILDVSKNMEDNCIYVYVNGLDEKIVEYCEKINSSGIIKYIDVNKMSQVSTTASNVTLKAGRRYYISSTNWASIGYRAKLKPISGSAMNGFVTCGHIINSGVRAGSKLYLDSALTKEIGVVQAITFNSRLGCDCAFVKTTSNSTTNYVMSNVVYYSNSYGSTSSGTTISSYSASRDDIIFMHENDITILKAGAKTYQTSGLVSGYDVTATVDDTVVLNDMVLYTASVGKGDSGGIVYGYIRTSTGTFKWSVIGIQSSASFLDSAVEVSSHALCQPAYSISNVFSSSTITAY